MSIFYLPFGQCRLNALSERTPLKGNYALFHSLAQGAPLVSWLSRARGNSMPDDEHKREDDRYPQDDFKPLLYWE